MMNGEQLEELLDQWFPHTGSRHFEMVTLVTPEEFRAAFRSGVKDIVGTLRFAEFSKNAIEADAFMDFAVLVDDVSFHGTLALVFVRQLIELGKERVPARPWSVTQWLGPSIPSEGHVKDGNQGRDIVLHRGLRLAQQFERLRTSLETIGTWESFSRWAVQFTACTGSLIVLASEVCGVEWIGEGSKAASTK
jgi:hypothetical protein